MVIPESELAYDCPPDFNMKVDLFPCWNHQAGTPLFGFQRWLALAMLEYQDNLHIKKRQNYISHHFWWPRCASLYIYTHNIMFLYIYMYVCIHCIFLFLQYTHAYYMLISIYIYIHICLYIYRDASPNYGRLSLWFSFQVTAGSDKVQTFSG
jgi:hypothetical protein